MLASPANRALVVDMAQSGSGMARLLADLGLDVSIVSRRTLPVGKTFRSIEQALADGEFGYVVVANETSGHAAAVQALGAGGHRGKVLIEKPVTPFPADIDGSGFAMCAVGYNLRFHPVLAALFDALAGQTILSMQIYCGNICRPGGAGGTIVRFIRRTMPRAAVCCAISAMSWIMLLAWSQWKRGRARRSCQQPGHSER